MKYEIEKELVSMMSDGTLDFTDFKVPNISFYLNWDKKTFVVKILANKDIVKFFSNKVNLTRVIEKDKTILFRTYTETGIQDTTKVFVEIDNHYKVIKESDIIKSTYSKLYEYLEIEIEEALDYDNCSFKVYPEDLGIMFLHFKCNCDWYEIKKIIDTKGFL